MTEYCLYGVKVFADFALFDRPVPMPAIAPGKQPALQLKERRKNAETVSLANRVSLSSTHGRDLWLSSDRELASSAAGQHWSLEVSGIVRLDWTGGESVIHYQLLERGTRDLLVFWFVHIFLPLYLTLECGYDFIHSAAVEIDGRPVLFIAPSTGGKSTLGDYFLKRGHAMLSDDKVATLLHEGEFWAVPSHPHHRPFREFEVLGHPVENFAASARPIHAFYLLEAGEPDCALQITEIEGFRKFEQLSPHYLFSFAFLQKQRLRWLAQLADQSVVFTVHRPWELDRMHEVYDTICTHSRSLQRPGS